MSLRTHLIVITLLSSLALASNVHAQTRTVSLAWDANRDPKVAGYLVYVGVTAGTYSESFDVGKVTSFSYQGAISQPYYFAVASYYSGPIVGPKSPEVASIPLGSAIPRTPGATTTATTSTAVLAPVQATALCASDASDGCLPSRVLYESTRPLTGLTPAPDGRVFLIEDRRAVTMLASGGLLAATSLEDGESEIGGVALAPDFARTGHVFTTEVAVTRSGERELNIVRYRELAGTFGQRAVIVAGLPAGDAPVPLTVDAAGKMLVVTGRTGSNDPYAGKVLRYEPDGTVPRDNPRPTSPVLAVGPELTVTLASDDQGRLWLAGGDANGGLVATLERTAGPEWPRQPATDFRVEDVVRGAAPRETGGVSGKAALLVTQGAFHDVTWSPGGRAVDRVYSLPSGYRLIAAVWGSPGRVISIVSSDDDRRFQVIEWRLPSP